MHHTTFNSRLAENTVGPDESAPIKADLPLCSSHRHNKAGFSCEHGHKSGTYCKDPKFLDRHVKANSADPDQTAPRGAV